MQQQGRLQGVCVGGARFSPRPLANGRAGPVAAHLGHVLQISLQVGAERKPQAGRPWKPCPPLALTAAARVLQVVFSKYCSSSDIMDLFCIATGLPR